jgi:hypothetical protein
MSSNRSDEGIVTLEEKRRQNQNENMNIYSGLLGGAWALAILIIVIRVIGYTKAQPENKTKNIIIGVLAILILGGACAGGIYGLQLNKK